jgi:hypothetical protein
MNGGGGSSCKKSTPGRRSGPMSTTLTGDTIMDAVRFQATDESNPRRESGGWGNPCTPVDPKIEVVTNRNTNPKIMKRMTNCVREIFIAPSYPLLKGKEKKPSDRIPADGSIKVSCASSRASPLHLAPSPTSKEKELRYGPDHIPTVPSYGAFRA